MKNHKLCVVLAISAMFLCGCEDGNEPDTLGYVVAMDTGSMVKGRNRFDYAVFDKDFAWQLGRRDWKVYKVIK